MVPTQFGDICKDLIAEYADDIVKLLVNAVSPQQLCAELGLCTANMTKALTVSIWEGMRHAVYSATIVFLKIFEFLQRERSFVSLLKLRVDVARNPCYCFLIICVFILLLRENGQSAMTSLRSCRSPVCHTKMENHATCIFQRCNK